MGYLDGLGPIVRAALDAGHEPTVERVGQRFRIVCSCGWRSQTNWTRKHTFDAISEHVTAAGKAARGRSGDRDTPDTPVGVRQTSGGRA